MCAEEQGAGHNIAKYCVFPVGARFVEGGKAIRASLVHSVVMHPSIEDYQKVRYLNIVGNGMVECTTPTYVAK